MVCVKIIQRLRGNVARACDLTDIRRWSRQTRDVDPVLD